MALFVLDTDHLSLFQRGHASLLPRLRKTPATQLALTIISAEEVLQGRLAQVRRAASLGNLIPAYAWLGKTLTLLQAFRILPFDAEAAARYSELTSRRLRIGAQDLRIASIALRYGGVLVTRNQRDFSRIAEIPLADWSTWVSSGKTRDP